MSSMFFTDDGGATWVAQAAPLDNGFGDLLTVKNAP